METIDIILVVAMTCSISILIYFTYKFMKGHFKADSLYSSNCQILDNMEVDLENVFEYDVGISSLRHVGDTAEFIISRPGKINKRAVKSNREEVEIK